ncbi:plasmid stabilization protein [Cellulomonas sp. NPDC089187]|uniref:FitA-like ribbon-helix-helix domain-containing protein n=1 Tax=Cellulomonas sp. NPDC089187 TaxID=3154970 RepID=UPI00342AC7E7
MAQLLVRNLSDDTKEALRRRAERHQRSLEAEAREILSSAVRVDPVLTWLEDSAELRETEGGIELPEVDRSAARPVDFP